MCPAHSNRMLSSELESWYSNCSISRTRYIQQPHLNFPNSLLSGWTGAPSRKVGEDVITGGLAEKIGGELLTSKCWYGTWHVTINNTRLVSKHNVRAWPSRPHLSNIASPNSYVISSRNSEQIVCLSQCNVTLMRRDSAPPETQTPLLMEALKKERGNGGQEWFVNGFILPQQKGLAKTQLSEIAGLRHDEIRYTRGAIVSWVVRQVFNHLRGIWPG